MNAAAGLRAHIVEALATGSDDALAAALRSGRQHGRPGVDAATKRWTARELCLRVGEEPTAVAELALRLAVSDEPQLRSIACCLLSDAWAICRAETHERALALACDPEWEVREWAAHIFGNALDRDFDAEYAGLLELTTHPAAGIRRAIALAAMDAATRRRPERAAPLLALVEPLLPDRTEYVRKNLGPFAIGAALLPTYPAATFAALTGWRERPDEVTRWNVAMACSSAAAARHPAAASAILWQLADDERRFVRGAVRAAARRLAARHPELALPS